VSKQDLLHKAGNSEKRMCIDLRQVNSNTIIPNDIIESCWDKIQQLRGMKYFITLDLRSAYHHIKVNPEHRKYLSFNTPVGNFQWKVMPFGGSGAPATWNRVINMIVRDIENCYGYFDDIIIGGINKEE